ncbi:nucleotide exchange factor GrpE [Saccharopolyspora taberi]|uniref:Nucleotide exchange factor GrpE n=1 Tax=Saccharopolyspora taberi TaxID=60895 RepID=A0ABN3VKT1_9PSEU
MREQHREGGLHAESDEAHHEVPEQSEVTSSDGAEEPRTTETAGETVAQTPETGEAPQPLAELTGAVSALTEEVREHHARAAARERVIDNLHAEVERLRAGEQSLLLRPIVTDLQNLRNDLLRQATTLPTEVDRERTAGLLESFALSVELALERCGSEPIRPAAGDRFDAREHRAVKLVPTDSAEQDETVAAVVADGYRDTGNDRITAPARVHVYRWKRVEVDSTQQEQENADA